MRKPLWVSTDHVIKPSFWQAHQRDENGDIDESLIPANIRAWYVNASDKEEMIFEQDSDVETD